MKPPSPASQVYQFKHFKYSSHYWILKCLVDAGRPLRILDVGTADGYLGAILKEQGHHLVGVEYDRVLAEKARLHYSFLHRADIETFDFPYHHEFDVVIFADVLEHLIDPEKVLRRALPTLRPNGQVIISVPNVANVVVRLALLFGHFDYTDRGILDRTHLRFFTLASLRRLVDDCAFQIVRLFPTPIPVQIVLPFTDCRSLSLLHELHYLAVASLKSLLAYQFVICAQPRQSAI
jgi:2-polyprenyl-3-methyl-5-hydroxy-6-metoxy-1,4-benzoquinol methylase